MAQWFTKDKILSYNEKRQEMIDHPLVRVAVLQTTLDDKRSTTDSLTIDIGDVLGEKMWEYHWTTFHVNMNISDDYCLFSFLHLNIQADLIGDQVFNKLNNSRIINRQSR